jgi:dihydroorotate dehydrogenase (fumarate)
MDLNTKYLGLELKNPVIVSSSPLSKTLDSAKQCEDNGAAAIVVYSLFEEQITHEAGELDHFLSNGTESFAEAITYFPDLGNYNVGPEEYLEHIRKMKTTLSIPVIGSLNGVSSGGWMKYAKLIEEAGADAIELNTYYIATNMDVPGDEIEKIYLENLQEIKRSVKIPVAMKLSPYFSSMANMAKKLDDGGADGLVLFNRFYQPDFDLEKLEVIPNLELSKNFDIRLPLRWIAILYGKIKASLSATSGVHNHTDVIKLLMAGADTVQLCSVLLHKGASYIKDILENLQKWMEENEYSSVEMMRGSMSQKSVAEPSAFERANYMKVLNSYKN